MIADHTLVVFTVMSAESNPEENEMAICCEAFQLDERMKRKMHGKALKNTTTTPFLKEP